MITSIRLQDFKGHRDTTVPLGRFTVLVGPNGSGKTSVLEALRGLAAALGSTPRPIFLADQEPADLLRRTSSGPVMITATSSYENKPWQLSLGFDATGKTESLDAKFDGQLMSPDTAENRFGLQLLFGEAVLHHLDPAKIAAGATPAASLAQVSADGGNTAAVLASLKLADDDVFTRIEDALRQIVAGVERIRVRRVTTSAGEIREQISLDLRGAAGLPARVISAGTLVTIALLTSVCGASGRRLVLLDDIDHALHPAAQLALVRQLKRLLELHPHVQIVATTHSPYILDELDPSDVHAFALRDDGTVASKRLSDHPEAERMKGALTTGQLWSLDPEPKWVIQDKAS